MCQIYRRLPPFWLTIQIRRIRAQQLLFRVWPEIPKDVFRESKSCHHSQERLENNVLNNQSSLSIELGVFFELKDQIVMLPCPQPCFSPGDVWHLLNETKRVCVHCVCLFTASFSMY